MEETYSRNTRALPKITIKEKIKLEKEKEKVREASWDR